MGRNVIDVDVDVINLLQLNVFFLVESLKLLRRYFFSN